MKAYEDWYYTTGGRFEALKSRLDQMTPDQIMMFRRDFAAKHGNDYSSFGHDIVKIWPKRQSRNFDRDYKS